jgi:hypothetical protein
VRKLRTHDDTIERTEESSDETDQGIEEWDGGRDDETNAGETDDERDPGDPVKAGRLLQMVRSSKKPNKGKLDAEVLNRFGKQM